MSDAGTDIPKVLFVDDEENILKALKRLFMDEDLEVLTANSGAVGLETLRQNPDICLIVSDQRMPEMSGVEFLRNSRELSPDALRIVLTGYADVQAAVDAINKGGAYRYISKPWKDEELVQVIKDAVQRYFLISENARLTEVVRKQNEELKQWNTQLEAMVQEQTLNIQQQNSSLQKLNEQIGRNFRSSISAFSNLIEMRDRSVSSHSKNVASLARQTAVAMSLPEEEVSNILVAALLHDIGKISIPDAVLMKLPEQLADYERKEYELHPVRGQVAIEAIEDFREVGKYIRHHHEQIDGRGFPDGLRKNDIPAGSRIIAIADAVDRTANSMHAQTENDYKRALSETEFYLDTKFDRAIFQFMRPFIVEKIQTRGMTEHAHEAEIHPRNLVPGMVLSRDVRSGTGLLLLARGIVLDQKAIAGLRHYYEIDPFKTGVFVRGSAGRAA
ncbi:MAG: response regulator [Nitrospirae bacterium]|nr:response regulator [Nitrospirota bacterium]